MGRQPYLRIRPWAWFLAGQFTLVVVIAGLTAVGHTTAANGVTCGSLTLTAVAVVLGIRRYRPQAWLGWLLMAVSQLAFAVGSWLFYVRNDLQHDTSFPAPADAVYLIVEYPTLIVGLLIFIRARTRGLHKPVLIDSGILATSAALAVWIYLLHPVAKAPDVDLAARAVGLTYPVMDLLVLIMAVRLMLGGGPRSRSYHLLVVNLALCLGCDLVYLVQRAQESFSVEDVGVLGIGYLISSFALGVAALHPSMADVERRAAQSVVPFGPGRQVLMASAALVAPLVLAVQYVNGSVQDVLVIAGACAILFLLVVTRMAGLVAAQLQNAVTDPLTGLYTRRLFDPSLAEAVRRAHRHGGSVGVLIADVDHFKKVNDEHGHQAGDAVLVDVAARLATACRAGDVLARYGGEEFIALLPDVDRPRLAALAETARRAVAEPLSDGRQVTASFGAAVFPADGLTADDLVRAADGALYEAKRTGRNRVVARAAGSTAGPAPAPEPGGRANSAVLLQSSDA